MTRLLYHYLHPYHHLHYSEMGELYVSLTLHSLALGVGGIFTPIYLFTLDYSMMAIAGFYVISTGLRLPLELLNGYIISRYGAKHILSLSYATAVLTFVSLYFIPAWSGFYFVAAVLLAFQMSWFWGAFHVHASQNESSGKGSRQISVIVILRRTSAALGPLLGGVVGSIFGLQYSLLLAAALLLLAMYPLFKTKDSYQRHTFSLKKMRMPYNTVAFFGWEMYLTAAVLLWPLFMYLTLRAFDEIGLITSLTIVIGSVLTYQVGRLGDKGKNRLVLRIGSAIAAITSVLRVFASSFFGFFGVNLLSDVTSFFLSGPFASVRHTQANNSERMNYIVNTQFRIVLGKLSVWLIAAVLSFWLSIDVTLQSMFLLAAAGSLFIPSIAKHGDSAVS